MKNRFLTIALLASALASPFVIATDSEAKYSPSTETFVKAAAMSGEFEIKSSKIALKNTNDTDVREFARTMIKDHKEAAAGLKRAVIDSGEDPKLAKTPITGEQQNILNKLKTLKGADFDVEYSRVQVKAHEEATLLFEGYSEGGDDDTIRAYAAQTLPTLQAHKEHADALHEDVE